MGQVLLVRHGQASWGAEDYDVLSPLGWEQGGALGAAWGARGVEASYVVRGSLRRHRETYDAMAAGLALPEAEVDLGWDEFDPSHVFAGPPKGSAEGWDPLDWFNRSIEAWVAGEEHGFPESFAEFGERVLAALDRTIERCPSGTAVVVTSGGTVSWVAASQLGQGLDGEALRVLWRRLNRILANSGVSRLVVGSHGTSLVTLNDTSHLEGPDVRRLVTYR